MARSFRSAEAKQLIARHQQLQSELTAAGLRESEYRDAVKKASDALVSREASALLRDIPIEEINRSKKGYRVKALREHGYQTIADIEPASVYAIEAVNGVGADAAREIKREVRAIAATARSSVRIRLSTDDQTAEATRLVASIARYRAYRTHAAACRTLLDGYADFIARATADLQDSPGAVQWLFASRERQQLSNGAYEYLNALLCGQYGADAASALRGVATAANITDGDAWREFAAQPVPFFNTLEEIAPGVLGNGDAVYGLPEALAKEVQTETLRPGGLRCQLRRYQEWGVKYALHQERVLLGDEMGLGKTVQAIAAMVSLQNTGATHFLVVCPASVLTNWCREIQKMSTLTATKIHGADRDEALQTWLQTGGAAVTTYETTGVIPLAEDFRFSLLVVDEAHYIKNPAAQRTANVKKLCAHAERLLFMTGTALENRVDEMVELIRILRPEAADAVQGMEAMAAAPRFREQIASVYYRRKRDDVLTELPELTESREWCTMTKAEEKVYEAAVLGRKYADARRVSWNVENLADSSKAARLLEIAEEAKEEGRKIIVFSFFLDTIAKVRTLLGDRCMEPIHGSVPPKRRQEIIDEFDRAPAGTVLAAQILSGGTGLNIQSASVVVICEPQFKPSTENQAISRAYRMGQTRNVLVYRLLCEDTVDERITELLENKQEIFNAFADRSEAADQNLELDDRTFGNIIQEEIDRINAKNAAK